MNRLAIVLIIKIFITILAWGVPLLLLPLLPADFITGLGFVVLGPQVFIQLLGMAYLALAVGYVFGLRDVLNSTYPTGVVWVGIISNGGAFAVLSFAALFNVWVLWGSCAQLFMWFSLVATGAITSGLIVCGPLERIGKNGKRGYTK